MVIKNPEFTKTDIGTMTGRSYLSGRAKNTDGWGMGIAGRLVSTNEPNTLRVRRLWTGARHWVHLSTDNVSSSYWVIRGGGSNFGVLLCCGSK